MTSALRPQSAHIPQFSPFLSPPHLPINQQPQQTPNHPTSSKLHQQPSVNHPTHLRWTQPPRQHHHLHIVTPLISLKLLRFLSFAPLLSFPLLRLNNLWKTSAVVNHHHHPTPSTPLLLSPNHHKSYPQTPANITPPSLPLSLSPTSSINIPTTTNFDYAQPPNTHQKQP